jgi:hypothetical protein
VPDAKECLSLQDRLKQLNSNVRTQSKAKAPWSPEQVGSCQALLDLREACRAEFVAAGERFLGQLDALEATGLDAGASDEKDRRGIVVVTHAVQRLSRELSTISDQPALVEPVSNEETTEEELVRFVAALAEANAAVLQWQRVRSAADTAIAATNMLAATVLSQMSTDLQLLADTCGLPFGPAPGKAESFEMNTAARFAQAVCDEARRRREATEEPFPDAQVRKLFAVVPLLLTRLFASLSALSRVATTLRDVLPTIRDAAMLEKALRERYAAFVSADVDIKRKLHDLSRPRNEEQEDESEEEKDAETVRATLDQKQRATLSSFRRDWNELLRGARLHRPELLIRSWCETQPWARKSDTKRARSNKSSKESSNFGSGPELEKWVEAVLKEIEMGGLHRPELTLKVLFGRVNLGVYVCVYLRGVFFAELSRPAGHKRDQRSSRGAGRDRY